MIIRARAPVRVDFAGGWSDVPAFADQELNLSYAYWEGAVQVEGTLLGEATSGRGYVELTGYSGSMGGEF